MAHGLLFVPAILGEIHCLCSIEREHQKVHKAAKSQLELGQAANNATLGVDLDTRERAYTDDPGEGTPDGGHTDPEDVANELAGDVKTTFKE